MKTTPDVTVLITIYNSGTTLDKCLESVYDQTYAGIEVLCVDDASTDDSPKILEEWQKKFGDERFRILTNEKNSGVTKSSCRGLEVIKTKYTARIDADDWWGPTKIAKQVAFMNKNPDYKIVGCNYININKKIHKKIVMPEDNDTLRKNIIKANPFAHSCIIFDTETVKKVGSYDTSVRYGADYDLFLRLFPHTKYHNIQEFLCFRGIEVEGISIKRQRDQMLQGVKSKIKYIKLYNMPLWSYIYLTELLVVAYTPRFVRDVKRALFG